MCRAGHTTYLSSAQASAWCRTITATSLPNDRLMKHSGFVGFDFTLRLHMKLHVKKYPKNQMWMILGTRCAFFVTQLDFKHEGLVANCLKNMLLKPVPARLWLWAWVGRVLGCCKATRASAFPLRAACWNRAQGPALFS